MSPWTHLTNIAPRFHLGRDVVVVPFRNRSRGNITCIVYMTEKWDLSTRHRPIQNVTGNTFAETVLVSKTGSDYRTPAT